jgi:hypothetical protein
MFKLRILAVLLLSFALSTIYLLQAQTPSLRYRDAKRIFETHTEGDFLHDDSQAGIDALATMWSASAEEVVRVLAEKPEATTKDIEAALCGLLSLSNDCGEKDGARKSVLMLSPHVFLVSQFSGEAGTAFVVGLRDDKPALLWSINCEVPQKADPRDLLSAWKADRAGGSCRTKDSGHAPGTCGPLWSDIGQLPPDASGNPRFFVDAGYAQTLGATIGKQTSVWRWEADTAHLLWIDWYDFMIDQKIGTKYKEGILSIGEKDEFRSFFGCGACEARQMVRRLRVTPTGIEDLGEISTTPELDLVDELFWRLANGRSTSDIAEPQVSRFLRRQILSAKADSKKIDPDYFSTGMLMDISVEQKGNIKHLCFTVDGDIGRLYFTLRESPGRGARLIDVAQPSGSFGDCGK